MTLTHKHRVRYHEVDAQGFMFNGRFLEIADVAMTEFFRHLGWRYADLNEAGADPSVVRTEITFKHPVRFDDELAIEAKCSHVGRSSFTLEIEYRREGISCAHAVMVYVNVDASAATSVALPQGVADALRKVQRAA